MYLAFKDKKFKYGYEMGKTFRNILLIITSILYLNVCSALLIGSIVFHPGTATQKISSLKANAKSLPKDNLKYQRRHVPHTLKISELSAVVSDVLHPERSGGEFEIYFDRLTDDYTSFQLNTSKERAPPA